MSESRVSYSKPTSKAERRTATVVLLSFIVMLLQIAVGWFTGSIALLSSGLHMGAHVITLSLSWGAYILVRRLQRQGHSHYEPQRILNLSAYTSSVLLLLVGLFVLVEAAERLEHAEVAIAYGEAAAVAVVGILTNTLCAWMLHLRSDEGDNNTRAAYMHVAADVVSHTGTLVAILCAWVWNATWIDAVAAICSSLIIVRWAYKMLRRTGGELALK